MCECEAIVGEEKREKEILTSLAISFTPGLIVIYFRRGFAHYQAHIFQKPGTNNLTPII